MRKRESVGRKTRPGKLSYSIPSRYYTDASVFEEEKEKIFYRTWQYAAHVSQVRNPGDYYVRRIFDQEIAIVRDSGGRLRAFYNVCQHRGHQLLEGQGNCRNIICPYHAWAYELDGSLKAARGCDAVPGFDKSAIKLSEVSLEELCGFIFVNLKGPKTSLKSMCGNLEEEVRSYIPYVNDLELVGEKLVEHNCNWKVTVENYNECYHCDVVHKAYATQVVKMDAYRIVPNGMTIRHYSAGQSADVALYRYDPNHGGKGSSYATWFIWPNVAIACFPGGIVSIRHFRPIDHQNTIYAFYWFRDAATPVENVRDLIEKHFQTNGKEDMSIVDSVQRGLRSFGFDSGPLVLGDPNSDKSEHGVAHIKSLYQKAIRVRA